MAEKLDDARAFVLCFMSGCAVAIILILAIAYCSVQPTASVMVVCPKCREPKAAITTVEDNTIVRCQCFACGFSSGSGTGFAEGSTTQYSWMVYDDAAKLASLMGGKPAAAVTLDRIYLPERTKKTQVFEGDPKEAAAKLVEKLKFEARVI